MTIQLDPGFYINLFNVTINESETEQPVMVIERSKYMDLKELRAEIRQTGKEIFVYAPERSTILYGYGQDMKWLSNKNFRLSKVKLYEEPSLASRMILEGIINKAIELGYQPLFSKEKGRCVLTNWNNFRTTADGEIRVFLGYDIRVIFIKDPTKDKLNFGLIADIRYFFRDKNENPLNFKNIVSKFGSGALKEVRQLQKDLILIDGKARINFEVSRQRLLEDIIPFIEEIGQITLPCGIKVNVNSAATRVVLGGEYGTIW